MKLKRWVVCCRFSAIGVALLVRAVESVAEPDCVVQCCPLSTHRITSYAEVAERQTHQLEGLAGATPWRFESSLPHHHSLSLTLARQPASGARPSRGALAR